MDYLSNKPRNENASTEGGARIKVNPSIEAARKASQMENAVSELSNQHARVEALIAELERRIDPILRATPPSNPTGDEREAACPLAEKLFSEARTCRILAERLDSIISRVDL